MIRNHLSPLCYCLDDAAGEYSMQCNVLSPASPFIQDAENVNAATWEDHSASTVHYRDSGSQIVSDKYNFMQTSKCFSDSCGTPDLVGTAWLK